MFKTIESIFIKKNILISKTWIQKIISLKNIQPNTNENEIYKEFLNSDISESFDIFVVIQNKSNFS